MLCAIRNIISLFMRRARIVFWLLFSLNVLDILIYGKHLFLLLLFFFLYVRRTDSNDPKSKLIDVKSIGKNMTR